MFDYHRESDLSRRGLNRSFFSRPPSRSYYFWVTTWVAAMPVAYAPFIVVRFNEKLSAFAVAWLASGIVCLFVVWLRVLWTHKRLYELYRDGMTAELTDGSSLDIVLSAAAQM